MKKAIRTLILFLGVSRLLGACSTEQRTKADFLIDGLLPGKTYFIQESMAGIPAGNAFPRGNMNVLKPYTASFCLNRNNVSQGFDLIIDYQFKSAEGSASFVSFRVFNINLEDNLVEESTYENLYGECEFNGEITSFENISICGVFSDKFSIEGIMRNCPFKLEVLSSSESADKSSSHTLEQVLIDYMSCWEETICNDLNQECTISMTTESGVLQYVISPGSSWKGTFYGDGGGSFWGGFCSQLIISAQNETILSLSGIESITSAVDDKNSLIHKTSTTNDWYLCSNRFGEITTYPYLREEVHIMFRN